MMDRAEGGSADSTEQDVFDLPTGTIPEVLTFLFADVRGYSTFASQRGDAAAALLAQKFANLARDAVEARNGRVLELRGDEVFAVFGTAAQAVRAAVELQATFAEESQSDPMFQLPVGIGIDTGEAVPVEEGYRGIAVNMAARLCSTAAAGQVLVTRTVTDQVGATDGVVFAERGPATFKGFADPVDVIEALPSLRPTAEGPANGAIVDSRLHAPEWRTALRTNETSILVGREHEMRWARGTWRQVRRGNGRVVCVSGSSQIGKTRLAAEIASYVDDAGGSVWYSGAGGTALADALNAVHAASVASTPTLVILDDIDAAGPELADAVAEAFYAIVGRPSMVLMNAQRPDGLPELGTLVERIDVHGDGHRRLSPLDQEGVREIGRIYIGDDIDVAPLEAFFRSSGGLPGRAHEVVSGWAREEATRRLSAAAEWLVAGRTRRATDLEFANNVLGLKLDQLFRAPEIGAEEGIDVCPYKGLATFREEDAALFFGRERLVGEVAARSVDVGLLGVIGASGSGKSSVVAAGLRPSLAAGLLPGSDRWQQVSLRPGEHPMAELRAALDPRAAFGDATDPVADALARLVEGARLVLVVDQFEEVFTTCTSNDERDAFIEALARSALAAPDRLLVVVILRADFYGQCATYPGFAALLGENHVLLGPMSKDELRRAIELPARRTGLRVESGVTERLVEDVIDEPGGLPLLSTALVELWQRREDGWLRSGMYDQTGGVHGAVARLAEGTFAELSDTEKDAAPAVFLRLVGSGEGDAVTRRRVRVAEFDLERSEANAAVIRRFTQDRLLTTDDGTVEVAHEAVLREWPRLQTWLAEDAQGREIRSHLAGAARTWEDSGHEESELYRGARLSATVDWASTHHRQLNDVERGFLNAGRRAGERDVERQRRTNRRLRGLLAGVAVFLVVALVGGGLAVQQQGRAQDAARVADARQLAAVALAQDQPVDRSLLLALAAVRLDDSVGSRGALLSSLLKRPAALGVMQGTGQLGSMALTPDGRTLAVAANTGDVAGEVIFFDTISRQQVGAPVQVGRVGVVGGLVISPDGRTLAVVAGAPASLDLIDINSHAVLKRVSFPDAWQRPDSVAFSPDGRHVAVDLPIAHPFERTPREEDIAIYNTRTGRRIESFPVCALPDTCSEATLIAFVEGGSKIVSASFGIGTIVWSLRSREEARISPFGESLGVSPGGETAAITHPDGSISIVDIRTGHRISELSGRPGDGIGLAFDRDGTRLAATSYEANTASLWDVRTGNWVDEFSGHVGHVWTPAFSPDGKTLYTSGDDGRVIAWDVRGDQAFAHHVEAPTGGTNYAGIPYALSTDGSMLAASRDDGKVDLWQLPSLQKTATLQGHGAVALAFSPDGETLAMGTPKGKIILWDVGTWSRTASWDSGGGVINGLSYSPDGATLALGVDSKRDCLPPDCSVGDLRMRKWVTSFDLWNVASGDLIRRFPMRGSGDFPVFSPDGRYLMLETCCGSGSSPAGSEAAVWDLASDEKVFSPKVSGGVWMPAFSPDSTMLAVPDLDGSVAFYDVPSGQPVGQPITGLDEGVESAAFSPDGTKLVTASQAGTVLMWDLATRQRIGAAFPGIGTAALAQFTPDGDHILATFGYGNGSSAIYLWDVDPASWQARACSIAGRNLTQDEWSTYVPDRPYEAQCQS